MKNEDSSLQNLDVAQKEIVDTLQKFLNQVSFESIKKEIKKKPKTWIAGTLLVGTATGILLAESSKKSTKQKIKKKKSKLENYNTQNLQDNESQDLAQGNFIYGTIKKLAQIATPFLIQQIRQTIENRKTIQANQNEENAT